MTSRIDVRPVSSITGLERLLLRLRIPPQIKRTHRTIPQRLGLDVSHLSSHSFDAVPGETLILRLTPLHIIERPLEALLISRLTR